LISHSSDLKYESKSLMDLPENWEQNDNASWFNQWLIISGMDWTFRGPEYQVRSRFLNVLMPSKN
tara:strand:- start:33 stop:227 length:195 start_codon:yes stop_codon:yes gene_type:complete